MTKDTAAIFPHRDATSLLADGARRERRKNSPFHSFEEEIDPGDVYGDATYVDDARLQIIVTSVTGNLKADDEVGSKPNSQHQPISPQFHKSQAGHDINPIVISYLQQPRALISNPHDTAGTECFLSYGEDVYRKK